VNISFEVLPHPPYNPDFAASAFGCLKFSHNISKELTLHVMKMFELLWECDFENSLEILQQVYRNLFSAGGSLSN
jgi:hypothetical protein